MPFSGHFPQILGDDAENDFFLLSRAIGYTAVRKRNLTPAIDFVSDFTGSVGANSTLRRPVFSPPGSAAFSVKRGAFGKSDVTALTNDVAKAAKSKDPTLKKIKGGILVTGSLVSEPTLDSILKASGIYCWDIRRLIFYSMKVKVVADLLDLGPVQEHYLRKLSGSFVLAPTRVEGTTMFVTARAFLDDHNLVMQRDHTMLVLEDIYAVGLKPILEGPRYDIQVTLAVHSVGPVQRELVEQAYRDYSGDSSKHPKALFSAAVDIQSYAAAPWTAMFRI